MSLNKAHGDMYPWVTHTWNPLAGECSHKCIYCYVKYLKQDYENLRIKYSGKSSVVEPYMKDCLGLDNTIFVCDCTDLFSYDVPTLMITRILRHCCKYPTNKYVFQTKNPSRFLQFLTIMPHNRLLGTTIETNRSTIDISSAADIQTRMMAMEKLKGLRQKIFVSIEPILDFDVDDMSNIIRTIEPEFISIGADSWEAGLEEPTKEKIEYLIKNLNGITQVLKKKNLNRLLV